jgi:hypothetical protein
MLKRHFSVTLTASTLDALERRKRVDESASGAVCRLIIAADRLMNLTHVPCVQKELMLADSCVDLERRENMIAQSTKAGRAAAAKARRRR